MCVDIVALGLVGSAAGEAESEIYQVPQKLEQ